MPKAKPEEAKKEKIRVPDDVADLVYTDSDKKRRAEDCYLVLLGKKPKEGLMSAEHKEYLRSSFSELLAEAGINLDEKDAAVWFIYRKMGGATRTREQQARIKKQGSIFKGKAAKEAAEGRGDDDEEDDADDDEDDDDE